jgi:Fic family protein
MFDLLTSDALLEELKDSLAALDAKQRNLMARSPLPVESAKSLDHKLDIELTHSSVGIEGNTLTLRETQLLIDEGITPASVKQLRELYEAVNHHEALKQMRKLVLQRETITEERVCSLHRITMQRIDDERSGSYRQHTVFVTGAPIQPMRSEKVGGAMSELVAWLDESKNGGAFHAVLCAAEAHYRFVKIHPFYDGNGRTARLLMNWVLLRNQLPLCVIPSSERSRYLHALDDADRGKPKEFLILVIEHVLGTLDQYLASL